jgi:hypothetical protein
MKTIYLSGASAELSLCESYRDRILQKGFVLTLDWMKKIREVGIADTALSVQDQRRIALADLQAVRRADIFWLLLPSKYRVTIGAWVELGTAWGQPGTTRVIISGPRHSIFDQIVTESLRFNEHEEAYSYLIQTYPTYRL